MKNCAIISFIFIISLIFSIPAHAQSAKNAVVALEKLETRCDAGVSYLDYNIALANAKIPVNFYLEGPEYSRNEALAASIKKVMSHYEFVGRAWRNAISNGGNPTLFSAGMESEIVGKYPITDKSVSEGGARLSNGTLMKETVFAIIWGTASSELRKVSLLLDKEASKSVPNRGLGIDF
jgi:hypothetical protein